MKYIVAFGDGVKVHIRCFESEESRQSFIELLKSHNFSYCTTEAIEKCV